MEYRADVSGCYVIWSPTLHAAHRKRFSSLEHTIVKIGSSDDIFGRVDNHNGSDSKFSIGNYAVNRSGYGNVNDWILWRLTTNLNGWGHALGRELELQSKYPRVGDWVWPDIHDEVSHRQYVPKLIELFTVSIDKIRDDFPMEISSLDRRMENAS